MPDPFPTLPPPLHVALDVLIWDSQQRRKRSLTEPGALPVKAGDGFQIEVRCNRPADLYLVWIDSAGQVKPVHPWKLDTDWELPPSADRPGGAAGGV